MDQPKDVKPGRVVYFDFLRILSTFAVIIIHVSAQNWYSSSPRSMEWQICSIYNSCTHWAVLVFIMISGALCLNRTSSITKLIFKNVFRFVTAYFFWGAFYASLYFIKGDLGIYGAFQEMLTGHYHMWFIGVIAGLYLCIPLFKPIVDSTTATKYFLIISFIFGFIMPQINDLSVFIPNPLLKSTVSHMSSFISIPVSNYGFCFICGYYLHKTDFSPRVRRWIYFCGILCLFVTIVSVSTVSYLTNSPFPNLYSYSSPNLLGIGITLFVFGKYHFSFAACSPGTLKFVTKLSAYAFGVYLIHPFFIEFFETHLHINSLSFSPLLSVPILSLVIAVFSFAISALLYHIPLFNKFIV